LLSVSKGSDHKRGLSVGRQIDATTVTAIRPEAVL
jgi:hypothetical protein